MNEIVKIPPAASPFDGPKAWPTTRAAEGVPRLAWTMEQFDRLTELGIFGEKDHIELIGGELVPMAAKGNRHERVRYELHDWLIRRLPAGVGEFLEPGWRPAPGMYLEPDIVLFPRELKVPTIPGGQMLLVIEIALSSLSNDLGFRARTMASLGVRDYWVVNAETLETAVYRDPSDAGFRTTEVVAKDGLLTPLLVPELALHTADLPIEE